MSWYYAGPAGKPVGPVTREEVEAKRADGTIAAETYVLENTGQAGVPLVWKRYQEVFPPPTPSPAAPLPLPSAHPLFPSATVPHHLPDAPLAGGPRTNPWCLWGLALSVGSLPLLLCGLGMLLAPVAFLVCLVGVIQLTGRRNETGWIWGGLGLVFSTLAMLLTIAALIWLVPLATKFQEQTATEQSTTDSD